MKTEPIHQANTVLLNKLDHDRQIHDNITCPSSRTGTALAEATQ